MRAHHPAGGDTVGDGRGAGGGFLVKLVGGDEVDGQRDLDFVLLCLGHQVLDDAGPLLIEQGRSDLMEDGAKMKNYTQELVCESFSFIVYKL